jgi:hypothetical protein
MFADQAAVREVFEETKVVSPAHPPSARSSAKTGRIGTVPRIGTMCVWTRGHGLVRASTHNARRLRIGAVAAVAAVGTDELAMEAIHLRATYLTVLTRRPEYLGGLRLLCAFFVHVLKYTATASL